MVGGRTGGTDDEEEGNNDEDDEEEEEVAELASEALCGVAVGAGEAGVGGGLLTCDTFAASDCKSVEDNDEAEEGGSEESGPTERREAERE